MKPKLFCRSNINTNYLVTFHKFDRFIAAAKLNDLTQAHNVWVSIYSVESNEPLYLGYIPCTITSHIGFIVIEPNEWIKNDGITSPTKLSLFY